MVRKKRKKSLQPKARRILNKMHQSFDKWSKENIKFRDLLELVPLSIAAYYGYQSVPAGKWVTEEEPRTPGSGGVGLEYWEPTPIGVRAGGAAFAIMSYKLATSDNTAAGLAGTAGLAGVGLANVVDAEAVVAAMDPVSAMHDAWKVLNEWFAGLFP